MNFVYQVYHIMEAMFGLIDICLLLALIFGRARAKHGVKNMKWLQWLLIISPAFPFLAIQTGWLTAEVGRQPYVVYPSNSGPEGVFLHTDVATSPSVQPFEVVITLVLFLLVYLLLFVGWWRVVARFVKAGPVYDKPANAADAAAAEAAEISFKNVGTDGAVEAVAVEAVETEGGAK